MKKLSLILTLAAILALAASLFAVPTAALVETPALTANYGHPTIDGEIDTDIYSGPYVMDKDSAAAWVGDVGNSTVSWYFAWDEGGLYYAGRINDTTPVYRGEDGHWVGADCLEISINPGDILPADDVTEGIFFSFGATKSGKVVAWRHNFADGLVSEKITGKSAGHRSGKDGYTVEVYIPWELIRLDTDCTIGGKTDTHLDSTGFKPASGTTFSVLPCAIDSKTGSEGEEVILAAYKFNDTDFIVRDFLKITLGDNPNEFTTAEETTAEETTVAETTAEITTAAETTAAEETTAAPEKSGCNSAVGILLPILAIAAITCRKKKD